MSDTPQVTVYSANWCGFCQAVKQYLDRAGVAYTEKNVDSDQQNAEEAMQKSGQSGIPVLDIDGTIIVGFDRARIDAALAR
ncbi:NrdH-redoxin [Candidatus Saccharibacteria bacterium]|nr:MAG: NrdH-redoxin [Candidatus Saccharibacteria bacterium]